MQQSIWTEAVIQAIKDTSRDGAVRHEGSSLLTGHSGDKLVGLLQRLPRAFGDDEAVSYLEVGVFQGLTLLSVSAANPDRNCYGIDNFAFFDADGRNRGIVSERTEGLGVTNAHLIDRDYEDALEGLEEHVGSERVGVYFIDGPHDYRSQLMCLLLALPHLAPRAIIVVDDANYLHVRQANRDFLRTHPEFRLLFEAYSPAHPGEMSPDQIAEARSGWWDGVNVLVRDPESHFEYLEPPTDRDRTRFENDHLVHASRLAELAPESLALTDALLRLRPDEAAWYLKRAWAKKRTLGRKLRGRSRTRNTYSSGLAAERWNPGVTEI